MKKTTIGIVGARGHVGTELIKLICGHPRFDLAYVSSRERAGRKVSDFEPAYTGELRYSAPAHEDLPTLGADAVVLALPFGNAAACVAAFDFANVDPVIVDLSADFRFDGAWYYGLPELTRAEAAGQRRPGPVLPAACEGTHTVSPSPNVRKALPPFWRETRFSTAARKP